MSSTSKQSSNKSTSAVRDYNKLLCKSSKAGDASTVLKLLKSGKVNVNFDGKEGTALQLAVQNNHYDVAKLLLKAKADVSVVDDDGNGLCHIAVENNLSKKFIELLLDNGCPYDEPNEENETPIQMAYEKGYKEIVKFLAPWVDLDRGFDGHGDSDDETLLDKAIMNGDDDLIGFLGTTECTGSDHSLINAITKRNEMAIKMLLRNKSGKWRWLCSKYIDPLYVACEDGYLEGVKLLMKSKACRHSLDWRNRDHETPLHAAVRSGNLEIIKLLVNHGANVSAKGWDINTTPLEEACSDGNLEAVKIMLSPKACAKPDDDYDGPIFSALHCAANSDDKKDIVELLLKNGQEVNSENYHGDTPLIIAAKAGATEVVKILLQYSANINHKGKKGNTALHYAVKKNHKDIVKMLFKNYADINIKNSSAKAPLDIATENKNEKLIKILCRKRPASSGDSDVTLSKKAKLMQIKESM